MSPKFLVALRGYDMKQVDKVLAQADEAIASESDDVRSAARETLRTASFKERLRGYARIEVDDAIQERLKRLA